MQKPHLVILETIDDIPVQGGCSSCPDVKFSTGAAIGIASEHEDVLRRSFDKHFRKVHMREDFTQAAARIVREATKD